MAEAINNRIAQREFGTIESLAQAAGLTTEALIPVRKGFRKNYARKTRLGLAKALAWPLDWYERLLAGDDPAEFPTVENGHVRITVEDRVTALEEAVQRIEGTLRRLVDRLGGR